jgi:hypothetical protein
MTFASNWVQVHPSLVSSNSLEPLGCTPSGAEHQMETKGVTLTICHQSFGQLKPQTIDPRGVSESIVHNKPS